MCYILPYFLDVLFIFLRWGCRHKSNHTCHSIGDQNVQPWRYRLHIPHPGIHVSNDGFFRYRPLCSILRRTTWPSCACVWSFWEWCNSSSCVSFHHHGDEAPSARWILLWRNKQKRSKLKARQQQSQQGYYPNKDENWISVSSSTNCCFEKKLEKKGETYLFGCCSQKVCGHLPTAFRQRSNVADLEEFPPYLGS